VSAECIPDELAILIVAAVIGKPEVFASETVPDDVVENSGFL
jgi:hypothetical protein